MAREGEAWAGAQKSCNAENADEKHTEKWSRGTEPEDLNAWRPKGLGGFKGEVGPCENATIAH